MRIQVIGWMCLFGGLAGCGSIASRPGDDFKLQLHDSGPLVVEGRVEPVELRFSLDGCEVFTVGLDASTAEERRILSLEPEARGTDLVVRVPVSWFAPESGEFCLRGEADPHRVHAKLSVHCADDGRTLESDPLEFSYATAWRTFDVRKQIHAAAVGVDGLLLLAGDHLEGRTLEGQVLFDVPLSPAPKEPGEALLTEWDDAVQVWSSCPGTCGFTDVPYPSGTESTFVFNSEITPYAWLGNALVATSPIRVPGEPFALAREGADRLVLLTESGRILLHLPLEGTPTVVTQTHDRLVTRFSQTVAGPVYLGADATSDKARLRDSEGKVLFEVQLPGTGELDALSLSPDGAAWGLIRQGAVYVGHFGESAVQLPTQLAEGSRPPQVGIAWVDRGIVVHGDSAVEVYEAAAPHALRFRSEFSRTAQIQSVVGAGDRLLVTTLHGVMILGADGAVIGGAEPMPCGLAPSLSARPAANDRAVVVSGEQVLVFKTR